MQPSRSEASIVLRPHGTLRLLSSTWSFPVFDSITDVLQMYHSIDPNLLPPSKFTDGDPLWV